MANMGSRLHAAISRFAVATDQMSAYREALEQARVLLSDPAPSPEKTASALRVIEKALNTVPPVHQINNGGGAYGYPCCPWDVIDREHYERATAAGLQTRVIEHLEFTADGVVR